MVGPIYNNKMAVPEKITTCCVFVVYLVKSNNGKCLTIPAYNFQIVKNRLVGIDIVIYSFVQIFVCYHII